MTSPTQIEFTGVKGITTKRHWQCPHCYVELVTYVTPTEAPNHRCPKQANRPTPLQPKGNNQ